MDTGSLKRQQLARRFTLGLYLGVVGLGILIAMKMWKGQWSLEDTIGAFGALGVGAM